MPGAGSIINTAKPLADHSLNDGRTLWLRSVRNSGWRGGSTFRDLTRRGRDATLTNGPAWVGPRGRKGGDGSMSFTAASSQAITTTTGVPNISVIGGGGPAQGWSLAVSMYLSSTSMKGLVLKIGGGSNTNGVGIGVGLNDADTLGNNILMLYESVAWHPLASSVGTGWFRVCVAFNFTGTGGGGTLPIWSINGIQSSGSFTVLDSPTDSVQWGGYATRYWNDLSDDVSLWERMLSPGDLATDWSESCQGCPNTLNWLDYPANAAVFGVPVTVASNLLLRRRRKAAAV